MIDNIRGNVFDVWELRKADKGWNGDQKVAVAEFVAELVRRIDMLDPTDPESWSDLST